MEVYLEILQKHFNARQARNPRYSLRAFSIDAGLKPGRMSDMFNKRYGLSKDVALEVANRLKLSPDETKEFILSVEECHARSAAHRQDAKKKMEQLKSQKVDVSLENEQFEHISHWYSLAIVELLRKEVNSTPVEISAKLAVPLESIEEAFDRLKKLKFLSEDNKLLLNSSDIVSVNNEKASEAIKAYHTQIMKKAYASLYEDPIERRDFSNCQLLVEKQRLPEMKEDLKKFRREFIRKYGSTNSTAQLYSLSYQLIPLEKQEVD